MGSRCEVGGLYDLACFSLPIVFITSQGLVICSYASPVSVLSYAIIKKCSILEYQQSSYFTIVRTFFTLKSVIVSKEIMIQEHTLLDSLVERKNHYQGRMAENMTNIVYFTKRKAKLEVERDGMKVDTEERAAMNKVIAESDTAISRGEENVEADQMLMAAFDDMIKREKKAKK